MMSSQAYPHDERPAISVIVNGRDPNEYRVAITSALQLF
ncbi:hypothetical protein ALT721_200109 [Alteromonas alvinellae]